MQFWSPLAELVQVDPRARADTSSCWETRAVVSNTTAYDEHQPLLYCCSRDMEIQCQQGHGRMHSLGEAILMLFHGPLCNDEKTYPNQMSDECLYECYYTGRYSDSKQGIMRLIVRECPEGKWGPPNCTSSCEECYNGGVCDDETGQCICAPGFGGLHCDLGCSTGYFGDSCISRCAQDTCQNKIVCGPDPLGCRCIAGFSGSFCDTLTDIDECSLGTDDCDQICENVVGSFSCSCWDGYAMDGGTCVDVDECSLGIDNCEHTCHNHVGNYTCSCNEGYFLSSNGWNCTELLTCIVISATQQAPVETFLCSAHQREEYFAKNHEISLAVEGVMGEIETISWTVNGINATSSLNLTEGVYTVQATVVNEFSELSTNMTLRVVD
ncbi:uncharacterized protein LOC144861342 isoform X2 [Branchiostoma floridae x Branchiostoma japonicum]